MWPWGHLAVGYLLYSTYIHWSSRRSPDGIATLFVALGTQFPDLIDKPLAWTLHVIPSGRSLAHSLYAFTLVSLLVAWVAKHYGRPQIGPAFALGYASHLVADGITPLLAGDLSKLTYLGWPLLPPPDYGVEHGFIYHFTHMEFTPFFLLQIALGVLVIWVWVADGTPGVDTLRIAAKRVYDRVIVSQ